VDGSKTGANRHALQFVCASLMRGTNVMRSAISTRITLRSSKFTRNFAQTIVEDGDPSKISLEIARLRRHLSGTATHSPSQGIASRLKLALTKPEC
jgi:hypothetical protein